jgi:hypothetical protein
MRTTKLISLLLPITFMQIASADTCPEPGTAAAPSLTSTVSFDSKTKLYTYDYSIKNLSSGSQNTPLDQFGLYLSEKPLSWTTVNNWRPGFNNNGLSSPYFSWETHTIDPAIANLPANGKLPAHINALKPGESLGGFSLKSASPPGAVQFFSLGQDQPPSTTPTNVNPEPIPQCSGWVLQIPLIQAQITGATVGPADPDVTNVRLRARDETGEGKCRTIDVKKASGKISVLLYDAKDFNASTVDLSTVIFGPGYAHPTSSKLVPNGMGEKLGSDERGDWEKWREKFKYDGDQKSSSHENLLLTFDVKALNIVCHLDQALFLRGKTKTGRQFMGAVSANVTGCKDNEVGAHSMNISPYKWWKNKK